MKKAPVYALVLDVFIDAKNAYYAFYICPDFWGWTVEAQQHDRLRSIDRSEAELHAGSPRMTSSCG
ncbi:MAG: DUF4411 family protein [Myxococcales bacterium]|nr:DUF4411 family protein [Myxococcales bacterium]